MKEMEAFYKILVERHRLLPVLLRGKVPFEIVDNRDLVFPYVPKGLHTPEHAFSFAISEYETRGELDF